jgi:hypothetical protein
MAARFNAVTVLPTHRTSTVGHVLSVVNDSSRVVRSDGTQEPRLGGRLKCNFSVVGGMAIPKTVRGLMVHA